MDDTTLPPTTPPGPPRPSQSVPGYRLIRLLSSTEMSKVYEAEELGLGRVVALKILDPRLTGDPGFRRRFEQEAKQAASLHHPNVVSVHRAEMGDVCYIAMQYVDGPDLGRLLRRTGPLDLDTTVRIISQAASALDAAHASGLIHRDIKPGNLLLDDDSGHIYIADFGISRAESAQKHTETGQFLGTVSYAPPEQIRGQPLDKRADVYALGCVLYECLAGEPPFPEGDRFAIELAHIENPPPRVTDHRLDVPVAIDDVVAKAMAKNPEDRYARCAELAAALSEIQAETTEAFPAAPSGTPTGSKAGTPAAARSEAPTTPAGSLPKVPAPPLWSRPKTFLVAGVVAAIALVVGIGWWLWQNDARDTDILALVPKVLRENCEPVDASNPPTGVVETLNCLDRTTGHRARFTLFDGHGTLETAYANLVSDAGMQRGSGSCTRTIGAEHRYPTVGVAAGRLLCNEQSGNTTVVWTDDQSTMLAEASVPESEGTALLRSWANWVGIPDFPAAEEKKLLELTDAPGCRRAPAGSVDRFPTAVAAIECKPPDSGATAVTYYRFADVDDLRETYDEHANEINAPSDATCSDETSGFFANATWRMKSTEIGHVLCYPRPDRTNGDNGENGDNDKYVLEWSVEPLRMIGVSTGPDSSDLMDGWYTYNAPFDKVYASLNEMAQPPFPTADEQALLDHIPAASRIDCIRTAQDQIEGDVGNASVSAVVCGPTPGADVVFYYQFHDSSAMVANFEQNAGGRPAKDCRTDPPDFSGSAPYAKDGTVGHLTCGVDDADGPFIMWTDERLNIQVFAYKGPDPQSMLDWWRSDAGPT